MAARLGRVDEKDLGEARLSPYTVDGAHELPSVIKLREARKEEYWGTIRGNGARPSSVVSRKGRDPESSALHRSTGATHGPVESLH
jgi:hypothetical protein